MLAVCFCVAGQTICWCSQRWSWCLLSAFFQSGRCVCRGR